MDPAGRSGVSDVLIRGGHLLDSDLPFAAGDIRVVGGRIAEIADGLPPLPGERAIEAAGSIVMPGLINAHTHSNQALEKGLCDRFPLDAWMVIASYGGASAELRPRDLYISAQVGAIEMIRSGTTAALDMARVDTRWFEAGTDAVMQAYLDIGLRAGVAITITDLDFASSLPLSLVPEAAATLKPRRVANADEILSQMDGFIARWNGRSERVVPMLGPSSLPRCSTELFLGAAAMAKQHNVGMQTHLLSAKSQVFVGRERYGGSTVEFLDRNGCLEETISYAHAIWLDDAEVERIGGSSAVVVHNPVSNLKLGAGRSPAPAMRKAAATIALGSDGASSADNQNMFETVKGAAVVHRIAHDQADWITAPDALEMCWSGGAAALRAPIGRLAPGYAADITILDRRSLFLAPKEQLIGQIVHSELGQSVRTVLVDGVVVMEEGRLTLIDEAEVHREAQEIVSRLYEGLPDRMAKFETLRPLMQMLERKVNAAELHFTRYCC